MSDLRRQHGERSPFVTSLLMAARTIVGAEPERLLNGYGWTAQADGPLPGASGSAQEPQYGSPHPDEEYQQNSGEAHRRRK